MSSTTIRDQLVDQLRALPAGAKPHLGEIRRAIGCSIGELQAAIQSLRYCGKLEWDRLELSPTIRDAGRPADGGDESMRGGPDDHDDYPGEVNDQQQSASPSAEGHSEALAKSAAGPLRPPPPPAPLIEPGADQTAAPVRTPGADPNNRASEGGEHQSLPGSGPFPTAQPGNRIGPSPSTPRQGAVRALATRAAARPVPAPRHESEVSRAVREEATERGQRRRSATSTATVSRPLALVRRGEMSLAEGIATMLAEDPHDLIVAINRRHRAAWARIVALGRARGERPSITLYEVLECGLAALEAHQGGAPHGLADQEGKRHAA